MNAYEYTEVRDHSENMNSKEENDEYLTKEDAIYKGQKVFVLIQSKVLAIVSNTTGRVLKTVDLFSIVGAKHSGPTSKGTKVLVFCYEFPGGCCGTDSKSRTKSQLSLEFLLESNRCQSWVNALNCAAFNTVLHKNKESFEYLPRKTGKYVVFLNPTSGSGSAKKLWENIAAPMFDEAGLSVQLIVTERANYARDLLQNFDFTGVAAIVPIGGDGIIFEIVNGLSQRSDGTFLLKTIPIAPLPGGTSNGLVKSILFEEGEEFSAVNAVFTAIKGVPSPLDLSFVQTQNHTYQSFLSLSWGLISDIDIRSENMRWMGETRYFIASLYFIWKHKFYQGRLSMRLAGTHTDSNNQQLPALSDPIPTANNGWTVIEGKFSLIFILQTSHCSSSMHSGPGVLLDDGVFSIFVIEDITRKELLQLLLMFDDGSHINHPKVKSFKATAYRIEPTTEGGIFSLDGEMIEYSPIQAHIMPSAALTLKLNCDR